MRPGPSAPHISAQQPRTRPPSRDYTPINQWVHCSTTFRIREPAGFVFWWRQAGPGLATRGQLRAMDPRPGGQEPVARIECRGGTRFAWLYRIDLAKPKIPMVLAKEAGLDRAMAARQSRPGPCGRRYFYCLPLKTLGQSQAQHAHYPHFPAPATSRWNASTVASPRTEHLRIPGSRAASETEQKNLTRTRRMPSST
ncbi:RRQRL motif-containing zinc-binding protein [Streptomyces sp. NPDC057908]|uniref:RRQRL motif-containing zinc-binding protein n=1 Tax=Streptomyces sp. NPDC057908 TaxID=3346276 RepID=UPI0036E69DAD